MGFKGGWSLDRSCEDPTSQRRFDFLQKHDREMAKRMLRRDKPRLMVLSPPCTAFSQASNMNGGPTPEALAEGIELFRFAIEMAVLQNRLGGVYVLENPQTSKAWQLPDIADLVNCTPKNGTHR